MLRVRDLAEICRARSVLTAEAEALNQPREPEDHRRPDANGRVGRGYGNHQRPEAHEQYRQHQRLPPAVVIREMTEQPAAKRPDQESDREQHRRVQLLDDRIAAWKKRGGEIQRKGRVGVEVVPLDEIADRTDENGFEAAANVRAVDGLGYLQEPDGVTDRRRFASLPGRGRIR